MGRSPSEPHTANTVPCIPSDTHSLETHVCQFLYRPSVVPLSDRFKCQPQTEKGTQTTSIKKNVVVELVGLFLLLLSWLVYFCCCCGVLLLLPSSLLLSSSTILYVVIVVDDDDTLTVGAFVVIIISVNLTTFYFRINGLNSNTHTLFYSFSRRVFDITCIHECLIKPVYTSVWYNLYTRVFDIICIHECLI